jgi:hypothetical protein
MNNLVSLSEELLSLIKNDSNISLIKEIEFHIEERSNTEDPIDIYFDGASK